MEVSQIMNKNVITIGKNESVAKAINLMVENRFHQLPVVEKYYEGMVFLKRLLKVRGDPTRTKVENYITNTPYLTPKTSVENTIKLLYETGLRALPILENKDVVGIISEIDILLNLKEKEFREKKAHEIMNKVAVLNENEKLKTVIRMMEKKNISSIPLIDWKEELSGCINIFTVAKFLAKQKERIESFKSAKESINFLENPAKNFSFYPKTVEKNESLDNVIRLLKESEEVIVVENRKPIGIIKARDIIESLVVKEKAQIIVSGTERKEEVAKIFERIHEKWKKVEKIIINIEKIGDREKYFGKIKVIDSNGKTFIASSISFDILSLARDLKEKVEREILKSKEIKEKARRKIKEWEV
ncbi:MAG: CBS domain-containing protein [Candidatus Aenigmatarchaeota archaeon]